MEQHEKVKCCRCRNTHMFAERVGIQTRKYGMWLTESRCPRCQAASYRQLTVDAPKTRSIRLN